MSGRVGGEGEADQGRSQGLCAAVWVVEVEVSAPEGLDSPVLFVEEVVVEPAEQDEVVWFGFAVVEPVGGVMGVAAAGGDVAAGPAAAVVADEEGVEQ